MLQRFRDGVDPYIGIASQFYGFPVTKQHPKERGTGKQLELSCGFGAGAATIVRTAARGTYGPPVAMTDAQGELARDLYRNTHKQVVLLWRTAQYDILPKLASGIEFDWSFLHGSKGKLYHPNGQWLDYSTLEWRKDEEEWRVRTRDGWVKIYGGKLVENVVQWLSRIVTSQAMLRLRAAGYPIVGMAHDDLWLLIPAGEPDEVKRHEKFLIDCMSVTPEWAPGLPLGAECKVGRSYA